MKGKAEVGLNKLKNCLNEMPTQARELRIDSKDAKGGNTCKVVMESCVLMNRK